MGGRSAPGDEQCVAGCDRVLELERERVRHPPRLEAPVVDDDVLRARCELLVVPEGAVDADRCRLIHLLGQCPPDRGAALRPETPVQRIEVHRAPSLVAAADAEVRAEQRAHGDHVGDAPRLEPDVLAAVVRVDARDVRARVREQLPPLGSRVPDQGDLIVETLLRGVLQLIPEVVSQVPDQRLASVQQGERDQLDVVADEKPPESHGG